MAVRSTKRYTVIYRTVEDLPLIMRLDEAAVLLKVDASSLRRWAREGKFPPAFKAGDDWRVYKPAFMEWLTAQMIPTGTAVPQ